jgi:hypothetical protein
MLLLTSQDSMAAGGDWELILVSDWNDWVDWEEDSCEHFMACGHNGV